LFTTEVGYLNPFFLTLDEFQGWD